MTPTVGFVLPTYKNPQQILRLLDRLDHMFASPPIACHHDFTKSYLPAEQLGPNVTLVQPHLITHVLRPLLHLSLQSPVLG